MDFGGSLTAAKKGDEDAFATIWREFQPTLLRYLRVKAAPVAEDLAAEIWLRVLRALPSFEGDEQSFRGWLFITARNCATDWYRGGTTRPIPIELSNLAVLPASNNVEAEADEHSATERALTLIAHLPPGQAEAVMLRIVVGLGVPAVANIMERSPGSVRVLCHRGLRQLESMLSTVPPGAPMTAIQLNDLAPQALLPETENA